MTLAELRAKRDRLERYALDKLQERDYHGVADAMMDLRELVRDIHHTEIREREAESKKADPRRI